MKRLQRTPPRIQSEGRNRQRKNEQNENRALCLEKRTVCSLSERKKEMLVLLKLYNSMYI